MKRIIQLLVCFAGCALANGEMLSAAYHSRSTSSSSDGIAMGERDVNAVSMKLLGLLEEHLLASQESFQTSGSSSSSSSSSASSSVVVSKAASVAQEEYHFCSFSLEGVSGIKGQVFCLSQRHLDTFAELFGLPKVQSGTGRAADNPHSYKFTEEHDYEYVVTLIAASYLDRSRQEYGIFRDDSEEVSAKVSREVAVKIANILAESGVQTLKGEVQLVSLYTLFCWIGEDEKSLDDAQRRFVWKILGCVKYGYLDFFQKKILESESSKEAVSEEVLIQKAVAQLKRDLAGYYTTFTKRNKRGTGSRKSFANDLLIEIGLYMDKPGAHAVLAGKEKKIFECIQNLISPRSRSGSDADGNNRGSKSVSDSGGNSADRSLDSIASAASGSPKTPSYSYLEGRSPRAGDRTIGGDPVISGVSPVVSPRHHGKRASVIGGVNNSDGIDDNDADEDGDVQFLVYPSHSEELAGQETGCCKRFYIRHPKVALGLAVTFVAAAAVGAWQMYTQFA